jgi:glucose/mannose transport system substrate-binding protein
MRMKVMAAMSAALMLTAAPMANAAELIVYHGWSTKAEVAALNVLQSALQEKGHSWKDLAIPHNSGVNVSLVNLVTGVEPTRSTEH